MVARLEHVPIDSLIIRPQVRKHFPDAPQKRLVESAGNLGVQQPILVFIEEGRMIVLDGERRVRAERERGSVTIPAMILDDRMTIAEILIRQLSANLHREDLTVFERAEAIYRLMQETGMTAEQVARKLSLSPATVSKTLMVRNLPRPVRDLVAAGKISADAAYLLARVKDEAQQAKLAERVVSGELTRDALAEAIKAFGTRPPVKAKPPTWRMTRTIGMGIALAVSGSELTLAGLLEVLEAFIIKAREAAARGVPLVQFLSHFNRSADGPEEVSP